MAQLPFRSSARALVTSTLLALGIAVTACGGGSDEKDRERSESGGSGGSGGRGGSGGTGGTSGGGAGAVPNIGDIGEDPAPERAWTIFVYGHGDHNLSYSLLVDLQEMAAAELGDDVNVLVLTDWDASQAIAGTEPPEAYPDGVQLFRVPGGGADLELVAEAAEANLDDPDILASVVASVFSGYPSERRAVILWDHGGSWTGGFGSDSQNGTEPSPVPMAAALVPVALAVGLEAAGVTASPPLDFVAFDTCLMGGAEVAFPFRGLASVYIANAEIDYGSGWDYAATLSYIAANPDEPAAALAGAEVEQWDAHHVSATANDALLRSHVALDLDALDALGEAVSGFTTALAESTSFDLTELGRSSFFGLPPYASQFENAGSSLPELKDLGQLLTSLAGTTSDAAVARSAAAARDALDDVVIAGSQGTLRSAAGQAGLHVEQGLATQLTQEHYDLYLERAVDWLETSGWHLTLEAAVLGADLEPPALDHLVPNGDGASRDAPPILEFSTPDADAAKVTVQLGQFLDDGSTLAILGLIGAGNVEAESAYEFAWDGTVLTFADGQPGMVGVWLDTGAAAEDAVFMVPGLLDGAAQESLVTFLVFGATDTEASAAVVSLGNVASTLSVREIAESAPGATFSPLYVLFDSGTGESSLSAGDPIAIRGSGIAIESTFVGAGNYAFFTTVTDVWGNEGAVADAVTLLEPLGP
jgi:hypothetical protein